MIVLLLTAPITGESSAAIPCVKLHVLWELPGLGPLEDTSRAGTWFRTKCNVNITVVLCEQPIGKGIVCNARTLKVPILN